MIEAKKNYKLAVQSGIFRLYPLELAVEKIKSAGYDGIELWGGQFHGYVTDMILPSSNGLTLDSAQVSAIKEICAKYSLSIACYNPEQCIYPVNFLMGDVYPFNGQQLLENSRQYFLRSIDFTNELGCKGVILASPFWMWRKENNGYRRVSKVEAMIANIEVLRTFVEYAEKQDVTILFEPSVSHYTNGIVTFEDTVQLMEAISSPNLQLLLDIGHSNVTATQFGIDPLDYFEQHLERYIDRLGHIHINDNTGVDDAHMMLGDGNIDFKAIFKILEKYKYSGWISLELSILGAYNLPEFAEEFIVQGKKIIESCY